MARLTGSSWPVLELLIHLVLLACISVVFAKPPNVHLLGPVDRTLHVRSIPAVNGYNSHIYEVVMSPHPSGTDALSARSVALLRGLDGKVLGEVSLKEGPKGLELKGVLEHLPPGVQLGVTVHESGDCRQLGPVFRPDQPADAPPSPSTPAGYLGSTLVSGDGNVVLNMALGPRLALGGGHRSILARGLALHPLVSPSGKTSTRPLACGVLGRAPVSPQETAAARRRRHFQHNIGAGGPLTGLTGRSVPRHYQITRKG